MFNYNRWRRAKSCSLIVNLYLSETRFSCRAGDRSYTKHSLTPSKLFLAAESETEAVPNIVLYLDETIFLPSREPIRC